VALNWREIDRILEELDLPGGHIQEIVQASFRDLYFFIYRPGDRFWLRMAFEHPRIHRTDKRPRKPKKAQRFAQFLKSRVEGGRITEAEQIEGERIIRMVVVRGGEKTLLWIRLWGGSANVLVTDAEGSILDAMFRRPKRGEVTGEHYAVENDIGPTEKRRSEEHRRKQASFSIRPVPEGESLNSTVAQEFREHEESQVHDALRRRVEKLLTQQQARLEAAVKRLGERRDNYSDPEKHRRTGDLIMSNLHRIETGTRWTTVEDFYNDNAETTIQLDPDKSPQDNAEAHYERYKKAHAALKNLETELENRRAAAQQTEELLQEVRTGTNTERLRELQQQLEQKPQESSGRDMPGLEFESGGFRILVGRTARENDQLLRRYVRGNDTWLHTRDYPGGYVFVRSKPGKSIPLEVLLDAGNLAVFFSKARGSGSAELFYTSVKYLRRAKHGKTGTVIPTHEKNLTVEVDEQRLGRLLGRDPGELARAL
jgi:predicted ribosome quality control (RQC) complex YloA/Tae2 family protein